MAPGLDHIEIANKKSLDEFIHEYLPECSFPEPWTHPITKTAYELTLITASSLSKQDLDSCFNLLQHTSGAAYRASKDGWKPRSKRKEMKLLDLKYILVKSSDGEVKGFTSLMPTYEDDLPVLYCYEIHLEDELQGTGLGAMLMGYLECAAGKIEGTKKVMLTCFTSNVKAVRFYHKLGFEKDEFSPEPRVLRNGTKIEAEYVILSKRMER